MSFSVLAPLARIFAGFHIGVLFALTLITLLTQARAESSTGPEAEFIERALHPFWREDLQRESLFFIQPDSADQPGAALLFRPTEIISIENATRDTAFDPDTDYEFDKATNSFRLPAGSKIPYRTLDQMYPLMTSDAPKYRRLQGDTARGVFFDNESGYHQLQVEVLYRCNPGQWKGPTPDYAGNILRNTLKKLKNKQPIQLELCGDSISAGYNASKFTKTSPGCPAYGELVALALAKHFGSSVEFTNLAVNGWNSSQGLEFLENNPAQGENADLVIIAFGMNDVLNQDAKAFKNNIQGIMDIYRTRTSDVEFILVSTMLGNVEWGMPMEQFSLYREALRELTGEGVVLVDITEFWEELLKHKSFYDLTGNGLNHPNDYGHLIYAQAVLSLLVDSRD